jgi:hypothetical protein
MFSLVFAYYSPYNDCPRKRPQMIRITVKGLAKFMRKGPVGQRTVLRDFKFPRGPAARAQTVYYAEARLGSWAGETHIQKAAFFLQDLMGVGLGFDFILYKHGPFSFDLRDELASMQADDLVSVVVRHEGYGPTFVPTQFSEVFLERFPKTQARYRQQIEFVSSELGQMGVAELEKVATAFFLAKRGEFDSVEDQARELVDLKPHISLPEALIACRQAERLVERAGPLVLHADSALEN